MKNYIANPQYSDASGDNWKVSGNLDAAAALNDLTKLSVGMVPEGSVYWAAHVEDISRLLAAYTSLTVDVHGKRKQKDAAGDYVGDPASSNEVVVAGDPYLYVDNIAGFATGQIGVVLEGLQPNHPPYSAEATSPDCMESEWLAVQSTGLIPAVAGRDTADGETQFCAYLPASMPTPLVSTILAKQETFAGYSSPTPDRVAGATTPPPSYYISAAGDDQANKNLLSLLPDFTDGFDVISINKGAASTTIALAGWSDAFAVGQTITLSYENTDMGWNAGVVTEIETPSHATVSATFTAGATTVTVADTSGLIPGMKVEATGLPDDTLILEVDTATTFTISHPATADGAGITLTPLSTTLTTDLKAATTAFPAFPTTGSTSLTHAFTGTFGTGTFTAMLYFASGDTELTIDSITGLAIGQVISGAGIPSGAKIVGWDNSFGFKVTIDTPTTADHSGGTTGTIHLKTNQFLVTAGLSDLAVGQTLAVTGIPGGTKIQSLSSTPDVVTMSEVSTGSGSLSGTAYNSKVFGATLADEQVRLTHQRNLWDCNYFTTPYYTTSTSLNSLRHGRDLYFPITLVNYRSVAAARFLSMEEIDGSHRRVFVDDVSTIAAAMQVTFGDKIWTVNSVDASTNAFTITSSDLYDGENLATYSNGDSRANIYFYDAELIEGATLDSTSSANTGPGVVTFVATNEFDVPNVVGNHVATSVVGSYTTGPRYIGSTTVGDLEQVPIYRIGTRTGTTLAAAIQSQVTTGILVAPNPTTTSGIWESADQYGITSHWGGWTPLVLLGDDKPIFTLVVGTGETQEMVRVIWSGAQNTEFVGNPHGPTMDGTSTSPGVWYLAPGQSFQYNHSVGEPICTPNVVYLPTGDPATGSRIGHAKDTPVLGAPDMGTVYNPSTAITDYGAAAALVAYNPSGTIASTADADLELNLPWKPSGDDGSPNISTTLATPAAEGSQTLEISGDDGFPTAYPSVLQPGIPFLAPEFGRVAGDVPAGSTQVPFKASGEMPTIFPFYANIGGEIVLVLGTNIR